MKLRVYIAGPLSPTGYSTQEENVATAISFATQLIAYDRDIVPVVPHLSHYVDAAWYPEKPALEYEFWIDQCMSTLRTCDAIWMFAESPGAMREWRRADELDLPRFQEIIRVINWANAINHGHPYHVQAKRSIVTARRLSNATEDA